MTSADLYDGEHYDARLEQPGWDAPGFDDRDWRPCAVADFDHATLVAPDGPPVRPLAQLPVREVLTSPSGKTLLDFGQNLTGTLRIGVTGPSGTVVRLRHAEVLEHGELGVPSVAEQRRQPTVTRCAATPRASNGRPGSPSTVSGTRR